MKRRGSALLVVLGVLSFLVVSAVSFAAFMRRSRLPSSYLRRTVAARQLAKAAVVRATDQIDAAIANGVHPGIGGNRANTWKDRVFYNGSGDQPMRLTAPVLTLEGLAYIPPPLVNETRYRARMTPTAVWQAFGYDVGRFAYIALDVSDYFDVNRLVADYPRSSAANRRVTISHIFENANHTSAPSGAAQWDEFMDAFRDIDKDTLEIDFGSGSKIPLVSVADFNLALADRGSIGPLKSPFKEYLQNGFFYSENSGAALEKYGEMTFVADGWFPRSETRTTTTADGNGSTTKIYDLADEKNQPYPMDMLRKDSPVTLTQAAVFYKQQVAPSANAAVWYDRLSGLGMAALADYLDEDRVPISLAVPTTERVPMICGVEPSFAQSAAFAVERTDGNLTGPDGGAISETPGANEREVEQKVRWNIKGEELAKAFMGGSVKTILAYPFLHPDENEDTGWTLDGKFSMFLTSKAEIPFRTKNSADVLHLSSSTLPNSEIGAGTGVINIKLEGGRPTFKQKVATPQDALWESQATLRLDGGVRAVVGLAAEGNELLQVTYRWKQTRQKKPDGGFTEWEPAFATVFDNPKSAGATLKAHTAMPALFGESGRIGSVDDEFTDTQLTAALNGDPNWSRKVYLNAAVWLRVKNSDGKVVDMVPASILDDAIENSVRDPMLEGLQSTGSLKADGDSWPVLKFSTGISFDFGIAGMKQLETSSTTLSVSPKAVMVPDPRFNHAPENWYGHPAGGISAETWLGSNLSGGRRDIFMATSDAGYLQSVYELAFLPALTDLMTSGNYPVAGNYSVPPNGWNENQYAASADKTLNADYAWNTYDPIDADRRAFDRLPFSSEGNGMKVNPYSNSTNVLMAAFANTPLDWRRASTNNMWGADYAGMTVSEYNPKHAWNEYSQGGKFAWQDLRNVAGLFMDKVRESGGDGWIQAWNKLDWEDAEEGGFLGREFEGDTDDLWGVDRKFFYGFWRDCFASKQQLFLVFVRAEPLMLGGGTADEMPPQLGARAVALVWRDAEAPRNGATENGYPHRTRLLFYRPLE